MNPSLIKRQLSELNTIHGLAEASKRAGLNPGTVLRILAGLSVREGTLLTAHHHLALNSMPAAGDLVS